jgi:hypothetical protein
MATIPYGDPVDGRYERDGAHEGEARGAREDREADDCRERRHRERDALRGLVWPGRERPCSRDANRSPARRRTGRTCANVAAAERDERPRIRRRVDRH